MKIKKIGGVWMMSGPESDSVARHIAVQTMLALNQDPNDFRERDKFILALSDSLEKVLDAVSLGK
jgi:hypothetical protein